MEYQYEPLRDAATDIRVAILQPAGAYDDELCVSFRCRILFVEESHATHNVPLSTLPAINSPFVSFLLTFQSQC
jgi:hypothetical protein